MQFITPIFLLEEVNTTNDLGDNIPEEYERKVIGNRMSIGSKEFYEAQAIGLKPEIKVEVRTLEYNGEKKLRIEKKVYTVIKTYDRQEGITELTLTCLINNDNTLSKRVFLNGSKMLDGSIALDGRS